MATFSQDILPPVTSDTPRQLVRSFVGIILYCLLTFFFFLSFVGAAVQLDTVLNDGVASMSQATTADVNSRDQPAPLK
jgi:hypothetical protein